MMAQKKKSLNIPIQVRQARNSIYLSLVVGFVPPILYEAITNQTKPLDPESLLIEMIAIVLVGFLAYMLGQRKNWARITLSVFFIVRMMFMEIPFFLVSEFQTNVLKGIVSLVQRLMEFYALIMLFSRKSNQWFKKQKIKDSSNKPSKKTT